MDQFPTLYTKRLKLRKLQIEDVPTLIEYANNKKISDHIINIPHPYREPDAVFRIRDVVQGFKNKSKYAFAISFIQGDIFLGEITLLLHQQNGEIGYWVGEPLWNQGIISEAIGAVLAFGFNDLNLKNIYANTYHNNAASKKALEKNGFHAKVVNDKLLQFEVNLTDFSETQQQA